MYHLCHFSNLKTYELDINLPLGLKPERGLLEGENAGFLYPSNQMNKRKKGRKRERGRGRDEN